MGKHRTDGALSRGALGVAVLIAVGAVVMVLRAGAPGGGSGDDREPPDVAAAPALAPCAQVLRVVTAFSFAPVLAAVAPEVARGDDCVRLVVERADGRAAAARVARGEVDLWIPDDAAWAGSLPAGTFAPASTVGSGTTVATSPIYMVTDPATAGRVSQAGGSWRAFAELLTTGGSGVRMAVRDPAGSGDGMVGAGVVAEAVWIDEGMDASALALANAIKVTRTVAGEDAALPERPGEVGLVPEYALLPHLGSPSRELALLPGTDRAAMLRYTWLPATAAVRDPASADALGHLLDALTSQRGTAAIGSAGLRPGDSKAPPPGATVRLPSLAGTAFEVLGPHHVDHVLATWYAPDRRTDLLVVVDVSGSMGDPAPGTALPVIELVRRGCRSVAALLPDDARLGLWEFGVELDGERDHRVLLAPAALSASHRASLNARIGTLNARRTGTGLYDTILAAYTAGRDGYQKGAPNQVLIFTDGRNEDDLETISLAELTAGLARVRDPERPVQLSVVAFGQRQEAALLEDALKPIEGYVDAVETAEEVAAVFIHQAAGGLHAH